MRHLTPADIANPTTQTGYSYVQKVGGQPSRVNVKKTYYQAIKRVASGVGPGKKWTGPGRATALEAAQDFCDYINALNAPGPLARLKSVGHEGRRTPMPDDPEVQAALGVLRDARGQREGRQGYVYLVTDGDLYKVGYSTNPHARVPELQTGNGRPLRLLFYFPGTLADEAALHLKYIDYNTVQEWFRPTPELRSEFTSHREVISA